MKTEKGAKLPVFSFEWLVYKNLGKETIDQKIVNFFRYRLKINTQIFHKMNWNP